MTIAKLSDADLDSLRAIGASLGEIRDFRYLQIGAPRAAADVAAIMKRTGHCQGMVMMDGCRSETHGQPRADLCLVATDPANVVAATRLCMQAINGSGILVFHRRTLVGRAVRRYLRVLGDFHAYPLSHELLVVEIGIPSLLSDARVASRLPRREWLAVANRGITFPALAATDCLRSVGRAVGCVLLRLGAPRRRGLTRASRTQPELSRAFDVRTFVNDNVLYEEMRLSFVAAGFDGDSFTPLSDANMSPYEAIDQLPRNPCARYPVLCHQDVALDRTAGAAELLAIVRHLDELDPSWVAAGAAGVTSKGRIIRAYVNPTEPVPRSPEPVPAVTLDECFIVFNSRNPPRVTPGLTGFHLYGTDLSLNALATGGRVYVVNFPLTHHSEGTVDNAYRSAELALADAWSASTRFMYVVSPCGAFFTSRHRLLRRLFGSAGALWCVRLQVQSQ